MNSPQKQGFTLIELLIVIALIAIIAAVAFVSLDPLTRFRDARDAARWTNATAILQAIKIDQVDNGGTLLSTLATTTAGSVYMIAAKNSGCDDENGSCDTDVTSDTACVDLTSLVTQGYLGSVPISGYGSSTAWAANITGFTFSRTTSNTVTIRACESENTSEISVSR